MLVDLHNHSCLSPCGSLELSPARLTEEAAARGNRHAGPDGPQRRGQSSGFRYLLPPQRHRARLRHGSDRTGGSPSCSAFSEKLKRAVRFAYEIYENLQTIPNNPDLMGDQIIVDEDENILGELDKHLAGGAVDFSIDELADMVHEREGLFIPAHIDRPAFSIKSQLGFLPDGDYERRRSHAPPLRTQWRPLHRDYRLRRPLS